MAHRTIIRWLGTALLPTCLLLACDESAHDAGDGELRVGLWGQGADGQIYSLHGNLDFGALGEYPLDYTEGEPTSVSFELVAGSYTIELQDWYVMRGDPSDPNPVQANASLVSPNPLAFQIADGLGTDVTFEFEIDGDVVPFMPGQVDIGVVFDEDDGVCDPVSETIALLLSYPMANGAEILGAGWQSFTASADMLVVHAGIGDASGFDPEGYTLQLREGVGPDGALLGTVSSCAQASCPLDVAVSLTEGMAYSFVSDADGWIGVEGAMPGAMSSEGSNRHRIMEFAGMECL